MIEFDILSALSLKHGLYEGQVCLQLAITTSEKINTPFGLFLDGKFSRRVRGRK